MNKLINPILFIMCLLAMACSDNNNENETFINISQVYNKFHLISDQFPTHLVFS